MDDTLTILEDSVGRLWKNAVDPRSTLAAEQAGFDGTAWAALCKLGVIGLEAPLSMPELAVVMGSIGEAGALVPFVDSEAIGRWLANGAGFKAVDDIMTVVVVDPAAVGSKKGQDAVRLSIRNRVVPWAGCARKLLFSFCVGDSHRVALKNIDDVKLNPAANLAREPHGVVLDEAIDLAAGEMREVGLEYRPEQVMQRGALCRSIQMLGAMMRVNELTLQYSHDRKQFKRALADFQTIQSYLVIMAGELSATSVLIDNAVEKFGQEDSFEHVAAARIRAGQASRQITSLGHQVHGAFGFTQEAPLNIWTRRLWAWREEYGTEADWSDWLGERTIERGADTLWTHITKPVRSDD
ncbi:MAG: acyl-CoA dehydrogenase family protein [Reyranellaceae bacterium]